jgi:hypothetical protein
VDIGIVLVPVVRLDCAVGVAGSHLQHHERDIARSGVCVVPLLRHGARVRLRVVHEYHEATADLEPGWIGGVVRLKILKVGRDLGGGRGGREAFLLVVNRPLEVPHVRHSKQQRQPVVGSA